MNEITYELADSLKQACNKCKSNYIALSGGVDSTIIALNLKERKPNAISVISKDYGGTDLIYCQVAAKKFELPLTILKPDTTKLLEAIQETISILKNFNEIEIRNNIVMYLAIKETKNRGSDSIITGDGADELFAGYNFLLNKSPEELKTEVTRIFSIMHFPTQKIGKALGVKVESPYLDENFKTFSRKVPTEFLVKTEKGAKYGKWVLRKTFENLIPAQIIWRQKSPMQDGSGTSRLTNFFDSVVSDDVYHEKQERIKKEFDITIRSKESMHYFEIFQNLYDFEQSPDKDVSCPYCHYKKENSKFCRMCGAFPI